MADNISTPDEPILSVSGPITPPQRPRHIHSQAIITRSFDSDPSQDSTIAMDAKVVVILLHGANSRGEWYRAIPERMTAALSIEDRERSAFTDPKFKRMGKLRVVWQTWRGKRSIIDQVAQHIRDMARFHDVQRPHVIAHSYGTYLISEALAKHDDIKLGHLILAGSVVPQDYPWCKLRFEDRFISVTNDCGLADRVPGRAGLTRFRGRGLGNSGIEGFDDGCVTDRYFEGIGHSDFFTDKFDIAYWTDIIYRNRIIIPPTK